MPKIAMENWQFSVPKQYVARQCDITNEKSIRERLLFHILINQGEERKYKVRPYLHFIMWNISCLGCVLYR